MRWPIRDPARGSGGSNGTIRCQNVNEPRRFIDEITCPREMLFPRIASRHCYAENDANVWPKPISIHPILSIGEGTKFPMNSLHWFLSNEVTPGWIDRCEKERKRKRKKRSRLSVNGFFLRSRSFQRIGKEIETRRMRDRCTWKIRIFLEVEIK